LAPEGVGLTPGADFSYIFSGENFGENSEGKFSPNNVGKKRNFPQKKFKKIVFPRNSTEFSAESDFPRKKMYQKLAPGND
jgi:hypothetical protein